MAALLPERPAIAEAISDVVARRRLDAASHLAAAGEAPDIREVRHFSNQILQKMRVFFRHVLERNAAQSGRG